MFVRNIQPQRLVDMFFGGGLKNFNAIAPVFFGAHY